MQTNVANRIRDKQMCRTTGAGALLLALAAAQACGPMEGLDLSGGLGSERDGLTVAVDDTQNLGLGDVFSDLGPAVPSTDNAPFAVALCRFGTEPSTLSRAAVQTLLGSSYPGMDDYFRRASFDALSLAGTQVTNWRSIAGRESYRTPGGSLDGFRIASDCFAQARQELNLSNFEHAMLVINAAPVSVTGSAAGAKGTPSYHPPFFAIDSADLGHAAQLAREIAEELGQGLEPRHAMAGSAPFTSLWDGFNFGFGNDQPLVRPIAAHLEQLGWLPASRVFTPSTPGSQVLHLERAALPGTASPIVAKIPTGPRSYYTVEVRRRPEQADYDQSLALEGVVIHEVNLDSIYSTNATLVDENGGDPNDEGSTWTPGETFTGNAGVTVSVQSFAGTGADVTLGVPGRKLTVQKQNEGSCSGSVQTFGGSTGIKCGADCSESYLLSVSSVTLKAFPAENVKFDGWVGCTSASDRCTVTMGSDRTVTAKFKCEDHCYRDCIDTCRAEGQLPSRCVTQCRAECRDDGF